MVITDRVKKILALYEADPPGAKASLARILMAGKLGGTGRMVILPVDQGFEHGPITSFAPNSEAYDPHYHYQLAIDAGLSAYAAPLGMLEAGANSFLGQIPLILKMNSSNSLMGAQTAQDQARTASVKDALRLGCTAVGFTIYPGSDKSLEMIEEVAELAREAKECGLAVVVWSYPRGGRISKEGESALDVVSYAAHIAALIGAHIIKVKLPSEHLDLANAKATLQKHSMPLHSMKDRVQHIMQAAFNGRRLVVFSGGSVKSQDDIMEEVASIVIGGGSGSIIGKNVFQRPREDALQLLSSIISIYHTGT